MRVCILIFMAVLICSCSSGSSSNKNPDSVLYKNGDYGLVATTHEFSVYINSWDGVSAWVQDTYRFDELDLTIRGGAVSGTARVSTAGPGWTLAESVTITGGTYNGALYLRFTNGAAVIQLIGKPYDGSYVLGYPHITEVGEFAGVAIRDGDATQIGRWTNTSSFERKGSASREPSKKTFSLPSAASRYVDDVYDIGGGRYELISYYGGNYVETQFRLADFELTISGNAVSGSTTVSELTINDLDKTGVITLSEVVTVSGTITGAIVNLELDFAGGFSTGCMLTLTNEPTGFQAGGDITNVTWRGFTVPDTQFGGGSCRAIGVAPAPVLAPPTALASR